MFLSDSPASAPYDDAMSWRENDDWETSGVSALRDIRLRRYIVECFIDNRQSYRVASKALSGGAPWNTLPVMGFHTMS